MHLEFGDLGHWQLELHGDRDYLLLGEPIDSDGKKALLNSPESTAAFQFIYNGIYKDRFSPRPDQLQALGQYKNMFLQGKLAM